MSLIIPFLFLIFAVLFLLTATAKRPASPSVNVFNRKNRRVNIDIRAGNITENTRMKNSASRVSSESKEKKKKEQIEGKEQI